MKNTPWVVVRYDPPPTVLLCERCKEELKPPFPISVGVFVAMMEAFVDDHRDCAEPKNGGE